MSEPIASDKTIEYLAELWEEHEAQCRAPLVEGETALGRNVANLNRLAMMGAYMGEVLFRLRRCEVER